MTTSLVTGGGGFIGSHLVDALLARGDEVRVLDNFSTGKLENLQPNIENIRLFTGDLRDSMILNEAVQGVDLIFHQAAFVSVPQSMEDPESCFDINVNGTGKLLAAAKAAGVKRVVLASSAAVYGENEAMPLSEDEEPDPLSPYAASKSINEVYARLFTEQLGLDVVALRYFNVYGPRQNPASDYAAVIPIFIKTLDEEETPVIFGDGLQTRDFVYISDVVQANLLAAESVKAPGLVFNICSGKEINLLDLLENLSTIYNRKIEPDFREVRAGDIYRSLGDPGKAREILGFAPITSIVDGLDETAAWIRGS
ncbi:MAG TPA: NAD-dependent epimerase/dehydratase family protein [Chloroflexi bacterium]|nr:NAD-dependent epimerase/dehydratase family protein [Chloroflexota bacterium]